MYLRIVNGNNQVFALTVCTEVEKFVTANTQELAKDKWLCPISNKKFKGPEFVRKHIFNKHGEKIEEVKQEVGTLVDSLLCFVIYCYISVSVEDFGFQFFIQQLYMNIIITSVLQMYTFYKQTINSVENLLTDIVVSHDLFDIFGSKKLNG